MTAPIAGLRPEVLDLRDPGRDPDEVDGAIALNDVGDVQVTAPRVARDGSHAARTLRVQAGTVRRASARPATSSWSASRPRASKHVFGIPGEETLDLNESLSRSSIEFVPVRHEQGGAYMADVYGRLTGHAGVCLGTLGPGALNLVTAVADAYLDRAPLVALTGQGDLERMHKESHQYIDLPARDAPDHQVERARSRTRRSSPRSSARRSRSPRARSPAPPTSSCPRT